MEIANNILKHYLKNVYFITGTAYAGKSTAVKMLAERYGMICCGENFHSAVSDVIASPERQPNIHYLNTLTDWKQFVTRSPEEYAKWAAGVAREAAQFEVAALLSLPKDRKAIVDTNIPVGILKEISDFRRVAVMLSPQSMSVDRFFERGDAEKQFLFKTIESCEDPDAVLENFRQGLALVNSREAYDEFAGSGFFTLVREEDGRDTREEVCGKLARHFGLMR